MALQREMRYLWGLPLTQQTDGSSFQETGCPLRSEHRSLSRVLRCENSRAGAEPHSVFHKNLQSQSGVRLLCEHAQPGSECGGRGAGGPAVTDTPETSTLLPGEGGTELPPCPSPVTAAR